MGNDVISFTCKIALAVLPTLVCQDERGNKKIGWEGLNLGNHGEEGKEWIDKEGTEEVACMSMTVHGQVPQAHWLDRND